jgi:sepiapterin reductase
LILSGVQATVLVVDPFILPSFPLPDIHSDIIITARSKEGLEKTKALIITQAPGVNVHAIPGDLGDIDALPDLFSRLLAPLDTTRHKQGVLINNAGTIDDFETPFSSLTPKKVQDYFSINLTSMITMTTRFLSAFPDGRHFVVDLTSLLARVFVPGFPLYSTTKAARSAFMSVLMAESPNTRVLKYSPGPCDTEMYGSIPDKYKNKFSETLAPATSVQKLVKLLKEDQFENGCVIDYYDE